MPRKEDVVKSAMAEATRKRQVADCLRLHRAGCSRAEIGRRLDISAATVATRLEEAGIPRLPQSPSWPEEDLAILRPAVADHSITLDAIAEKLPHRSRPAIRDKLQLMRLAAGTPRRPKLRAEADDSAASGPSWTLPAGAYRDRRGITLALVSAQEVTHFDGQTRRD